MALPVSSYLRGILALYFLSSSLVASRAWAITPEEKAGARAAAQQGAEAFQAGDYQRAVDYFTRAESIIHAPPHLLYIARAELKLGHLVAAREAYMKIIHEELPSSAPKVFLEAKKDAEAELEELEPRLPHVSALVEGAEDREVIVSRDGVELPAALVGIPVPTDPGSHTYEARARGFASQPKSVTVEEGEKASVVLTLVPTGEPLDEEEEVRQGSAEGAVPPSSSEKAGSTALKVLGFSGLGLGVAGLATGTAYLVISADTQGKSNQIFDACNPLPGGCMLPQRDEISRLDNEAQTQRVIGYVSLGVGGALLATGITLLIVGSKSKQGHARESQIWPVVGLSSLGVAGTF